MTGRRAKARRGAIRVDLQAVADMVQPGARVLDIGCGNGELLDHLVHDKQVDWRTPVELRAGDTIILSPPIAGG